MKYTLYILIAIFMFSFISCEDIKFGDDFLEKPDSDNLTQEEVFSSQYLSDQVLAEAYKSLPDFLSQRGRLQWSVLEVLTDLAERGNSANDFQAGKITSSSDSHPFKLSNLSDNGVGDPIYGIRQALLYIENIDKVPDMSDELKQIRKQEAYMIIAMNYTEIFRYMGGMPMMEKTYNPTDDFKMTRLTVEEMVSKIVTLCDNAAKVLPWSVSEVENGHFTAAGAKALKFRVLLHAASPLFNNAEPFMPGEAAEKHYIWYGDYSEQRWRDALEAGLDFIQTNQENNNFYKLVGEDDNLKMPADFDAIRANFASAYFDRFNKENLIEGHRYTKYASSFLFTQQCRYGNNSPTLNLHDKFQKLDGSNFDWKNEEDTSNPFFESMTVAELDNKKFFPVPKRDPRLYETITVHGDKFQTRKMDCTLDATAMNSTFGTKDYMNRSGMGMRKFFRDNKKEVVGMFYSCPLLRLPEIYLGIAECMNELGLTNTADKFGNTAYDYVNKVRNRVGMPGIMPSGTKPQLVVAPGEDFLNYLLDERARELSFEEVRYHDLNRRKRQDLITLSVDGMNVEKNGTTYTYSRGRKFSPTRLWIDNWTPRYYLTPIPLDEINKGYGLIQNPGW